MCSRLTETDRFLPVPLTVQATLPEQFSGVWVAVEAGLAGVRDCRQVARTGHRPTGVLDLRGSPAVDDWIVEQT